MSGEQTHIAIDLRLDGEHFSGQASAGRGEPESFLGWVGLIGALDRLLERARPAGRRSTSDESSGSLESGGLS